MTRLFLEISNDILSDLVFDKDTVTMKNHLDTTAGVLEALMKSDINAIRQLFKDGYTMQLVPGAISESFTECSMIEQHEIRVYDNETLLGVIINIISLVGKSNKQQTTKTDKAYDKKSTQAI